MSNLFNPLLLNRVSTINLVSPTQLTNYATFTRASAAGTWVGGTWTTFASGVPRFGSYDNDGYNGLVLECVAATNLVYCNDMTGVVTGTPGTYSTHCTNTAIPPDAGLTQSIVGKGTVNGLPYMDVRFNGTSIGGTTFVLQFMSPGDAPAVQNNSTASSAFVALVGGSLSGITSVNLRNAEWDSGLNFLGEFSGSDFKGSLTSNPQRFSLVRTVSGATATSITSYLGILIPALTAVDITLRIAAPQAELGLFASSIIFTTSGSVIRAADSCFIANINTKPWFNQLEGVFSTDSKRGNDVYGPYSHLFNANDGTLDNAIFINSQGVSTSSDLFGEMYTATVQQIDFEIFNAAQNIRLKSAYGYKVNNCAMAVNGISPFTTSSATIPTGMTTLNIGNTGAFPQPFSGTMASFTYYPVRLSNTTIQALTV